MKRDEWIPTFTVLDASFVLFSLSTYLADTTTDIMVAVQYIREGEVAWSSITVLFIIVPSLVMQVFSSRWHITDNTMKSWLWLIHVLQLGPAHRYLAVLRAGFKARKTGNLHDFEIVYQEQRDVAMLRLFESFTECAPQLVLQMYIMTTTSDWNPLTGISAIVSLVSLAWAIAAYSKSMRNAREDKQRLGYTGLVLQTIWRMGSCASRVVALVMFAAVFKGWMCFCLGLHWIVMTGWIFSQKTDFCESWWEERLFNIIVAAIYCFSFFNLKEGITRYRLLAFDTVMLAENTLFMAIAYSYGTFRRDWFSIAALVIVWGGFLIGGISMLLYYRFFHPTGPIHLCKPGTGNRIKFSNAMLEVHFAPRSQTTSMEGSPAAASDPTVEAMKYMEPASPLPPPYCTEVCCVPNSTQPLNVNNSILHDSAFASFSPPCKQEDKKFNDCSLAIDFSANHSTGVDHSDRKFSESNANEEDEDIVVDIRNLFPQDFDLSIPVMDGNEHVATNPANSRPLDPQILTEELEKTCIEMTKPGYNKFSALKRRLSHNRPSPARTLIRDRNCNLDKTDRNGHNESIGANFRQNNISKLIRQFSLLAKTRSQVLCEKGDTARKIKIHSTDDDDVAEHLKGNDSHNCGIPTKISVDEEHDTTGCDKEASVPEKFPELDGGFFEQLKTSKSQNDFQYHNILQDYRPQNDAAFFAKCTEQKSISIQPVLVKQSSTISISKQSVTNSVYTQNATDSVQIQNVTRSILTQNAMDSGQAQNATILLPVGNAANQLLTQNASDSVQIQNATSCLIIPNTVQVT